MSADYGYANARLRAHAARLLTAGDFEALLARDSISALVAALAATPYKDAVEAGLLHAGGIQAVFEALRLDVALTFRRVRSFFDAGEPQELADLLLSRWDLHNVRALVRGQIAHVPVAEILETVIPAGALDKRTLEALAQQPGLQAMVDLMLTQQLPYANALSTAMQAPPRGKETAALELALDNHHSRSALLRLEQPGANPAVVRSLIQAEIDCANLCLLLRLQREEAAPGAPEPADWLIDGGSIGLRRLQALAEARSPDETAALLAGTPYAEVIAGAQGGAAAACRLLDRFLIRQGTGLWNGDPLGIDLFAGYMWAKISEVMNLRLIAYAVAGELPRSDVREELLPWRS